MSVEAAHDPTRDRLQPRAAAALPAGLRLPAVIGHRGAAAHAPENTLASIRKASELGASWVEFDVKLTRDSIPILMHDERLERTTDGRGQVRDRTLAEIRACDAGGWFDPVFAGERVPTFEDALRLCAELGLGVNVEIKPCPGRAVETARRTVEVLRAIWPRDAQAPLISSFTPACLEVVRASARQWPLGYLCNSLPRAWRAALERYSCATLHANHRRLTMAGLRAVVGASVPLVLYTVNDPARAKTLRAAGAASIITDRVKDMLDALA